MIRINLLNDWVQFTLTGTPEEQARDKDYLENALCKRNIDYRNSTGQTVSDCDLYVHISNFKSANEIRDLLTPDLGVQDKKKPQFFQNPSVDYKFQTQNKIGVDELIDNKIEILRAGPRGPQPQDM
ncbi:hypothetical protein [Legionella feeleii]|uniref:Uncharacterized protein n=1 Tax=Legionella feeleii TaxID=453 RepID=A0A0W0U7I8_9GAMM|nr:hypothetical protein [Legionella feeleii]KTD03670.1 hypothetical protein Lfee_0416 [Legionella feeleii]SPX59251.1 Uncharacterised protein [Legionella feeleii]